MAEITITIKDTVEEDGTRSVTVDSNGFKPDDIDSLRGAECVAYHLMMYSAYGIKRNHRVF